MSKNKKKAKGITSVEELYSLISDYENLFTPENIYESNGRWWWKCYKDKAIEVTYVKVWWKCPKCKQSYAETIPARIKGKDCPNKC
jgi:hypothetical protein